VAAILTPLSRRVSSSGGEMATPPRKMFGASRDQIEPAIAAVSTILVVLSIAIVAAIAVIRPHVECDR
jgi:ABC-type spermidine/putrescine transport system permease subunit II